jgi:hypothetical protein
MAKMEVIYKIKESMGLSKAKKGYDFIHVRKKEDLFEFAQRLDMVILEMINCNQPLTDEANCLTLQNALDNRDEDVMFLRTKIKMIDKPTYAKYVKALKALHLSMNVIKFGNQKKQSRDSIRFTDQVPMCEYCHKRGHLVQACQIKIADKKICAKKHGKGVNNGRKGQNEWEIEKTNATIPTRILTTRSRVKREETMTV